MFTAELSDTASARVSPENAIHDFTFVLDFAGRITLSHLGRRNLPKVRWFLKQSVSTDAASITESQTSSQLSAKPIQPHEDYQDEEDVVVVKLIKSLCLLCNPFRSSQLSVPSSFYLLAHSSPHFPPPPSGSLCFISNLINSSEAQPFTLNPHLPVHMATGWPPSHTRL